VILVRRSQAIASVEFLEKGVVCIGPYYYCYYYYNNHGLNLTYLQQAQELEWVQNTKPIVKTIE